MLDRERGKVDVLLTPACADLSLRTPRVLLRPVRFGDSVAIKKIKTEPIVQKTQLYGTPRSLQEIKANFQTRYIASCIPAISRDEYAPEGEEAQGGAWRDEYIWAITVKPAKAGEVKILPAGEVRLQNRLANLDGYVGESESSRSFGNGLKADRQETLRSACPRSDHCGHRKARYGAIRRRQRRRRPSSRARCSTSCTRSCGDRA